MFREFVFLRLEREGPPGQKWSSSLAGQGFEYPQAHRKGYDCKPFIPEAAYWNRNRHPREFVNPKAPEPPRPYYAMIVHVIITTSTRRRTPITIAYYSIVDYAILYYMVVDDRQNGEYSIQPLTPKLRCRPLLRLWPPHRALPGWQPILQSVWSRYLPRSSSSLGSFSGISCLYVGFCAYRPYEALRASRVE